MHDPLNTLIEIHIKSLTQKQYAQLLSFVDSEGAGYQGRRIFSIINASASDDGRGLVYRNVVVGYKRREDISKIGPQDRMKILGGRFAGLMKTIVEIESELKTE